MKFWKITCIVLDSFFLLVALILTLRMCIGIKEETAYKIGYMIGHLFSFLPALIFFYLAYRLHKKIITRKLQREVDSFLNNK